TNRWRWICADALRIVAAVGTLALINLTVRSLQLRSNVATASLRCGRVPHKRDRHPCPVATRLSPRSILGAEYHEKGHPPCSSSLLPRPSDRLPLCHPRGLHNQRRAALPCSRVP